VKHPQSDIAEGTGRDESGSEDLGFVDSDVVDYEVTEIENADHEAADADTGHAVAFETSENGEPDAGSSEISTPEDSGPETNMSEASAREASTPETHAIEGDAPQADAIESDTFEADAVAVDAPETAQPADADVSRETSQPIIEESAAAAPLGSTFDDSTPLARELAEITRRRVAIESSALPLPVKPRIFTIANQKGGVGKTTTTVNLAAALARAGANVLVIDLDPQGNASTALGVEHRADTISVYDVIINDEPMSQVVQKSPEFEGLYCVPATIHLAGAEIELVSLVAREQRLHTALDKFLGEAAEEFHYVFIDCPPSLGLLTINAFVAAREVLIPIQCEYYALEGLSQLLNNIKLIERHLNPRLKVSTILLTMYDARTNLANQVVDDVREHFPKEVLNTVIPRSVRISEAPSYGQSVISYDPTSPGSLSYLEAAAEIARRGAPA